ncbi:hypothetical protein ACSYDW_09785 [Paeniglutamicibacter sp. R2-26]|uniref:hypothetical protein n=1 Tax=Paeniglutamicibacter sp. R2-26 TaxID=3144417 RepID=UPI003EE554A1
MRDGESTRMQHLRTLEKAVPEIGWKPTYAALIDGRREFAGLVESGVWRGHEILILVYGPAEPTFASIRRFFRPKKRAADRPFKESDYLFSADYWQLDPQAHGGEEPDMSFSSLTDLEQWIGPGGITWYSPLESVDAVGKMLV